MSAEPAEWTDCYESPARCPRGHEFTAAWYDTKRADQTCPECGAVFRATWAGFEAEPEVVIVDSRKAPGRDAA